MRAFPIRNDADLFRAIDLVDALWDAPSGSPEADLREVMALVIEHYEAGDLAQVLPPPDPLKVLEAKCKELGLSQRKLGELLGWKSSGRVSEVLSGKRHLTLDMVRDLERVLGISPGLLVADRASTADGEVWVRLPGTLVAAARSANFCGCAGLDALVRGAVSATLRAPGLTSAVSLADLGLTSGGRPSRADLTLKSAPEVA
jgi:HTH-type transcriptional regulator/antitoxin HigA